MRNKLIFLIAPAGLLILLLVLSFILPPHDDASASGLDDFSMVVDKPLDEPLPAGAVSAKYIVEHRSALNGSPIRLQGVIVEPSLSQGRIFLADSNKPGRNTAYDVMVMVGSGFSTRDYLPGSRITITGRVNGNAGSVALQKIN